MMRKNQILTWVVVLLAITNTATIGTILYHNYQEKKQEENITINTGSSGGNMLNGRFLRQTLGFNNDQMNAFRQVNRAFRPYAMELTTKIDSFKSDMFIELQKSVPDTGRLNSMSEQIGDLHGTLKYETYKFYLNIKKICTPEQSEELKKTFQPLFKNEAFTIPSNHRKQEGLNRK